MTETPHPFEQTREALDEVVADIQSLADELSARRDAVERQFGPEIAAVVAAKQAVEEQDRDLRQRLAVARREIEPIAQKLAALRAEEKRLRAELKPLAMENAIPWTPPSSPARTVPSTSLVAGVEMRKQRQARVLDEDRAADLLAGLTHPDRDGVPKPLFTARIAYTWNMPGIRAYLLADERRRVVPGVLELTALDDPASWRMRTVPRTEEPPPDP